MSRIQSIRQRILKRETLTGTFMKTPHYVLVEVFAQSDFDFICLDAEHAPFDRQAIDQCMAVSRALDFPVFVRTGDGSGREILWALDCGAAGIVVPHVDTVEKAESIAKSARFGLGGRGFAGSSRWAGYATRTMPDLLKQSLQETAVIAQIEEPCAIDLAADVAAVEGIDALFAGPADLSVGMGYDHQNSEELRQALFKIGRDARNAGKGHAGYVGDSDSAFREASEQGMHMFFVASEHSFMRGKANEIVKRTVASRKGTAHPTNERP